jgi:hypothetical protein
MPSARKEGAHEAHGQTHSEAWAGTGWARPRWPSREAGCSWSTPTHREVHSPGLRSGARSYEPYMQISRFRLSDKTSRLHPRHVVPKPAQAYEPEVPVKVREWISPVVGMPKPSLHTIRVQPSPYDVWAAAETAAKARQFKDRLEAVFVI